MLNSLRIKRDTIAMESFSSMNLHGILKDVFPNMIKGLTGFVNNFAPEAPPIVLTSKQTDFIKELSKHSYLDISPLAAFVPEGLDVTYLKYSDSLLDSVNLAVQVMDKVLAPYSLYLSQLITNSEQKFSTASAEALYKERTKLRAEVNKDLGACFKHGSTKTEVTFGAVVERNADWPHVFQYSDQAVNKMNSVDRKALSKKIKECTELLGVIGEKIKRNEFEGVSNQVVKNLADGAYEVACELEFFSVTYYKVLAFAESINRSVAHFQKTMSR